MKPNRIAGRKSTSCGAWAAAAASTWAPVFPAPYAGQLSGDIGHIEAERNSLRRQIELCRQALLRADQAVKSLEKLAERQRTEFVFTQHAVESRELEQTWQAIHAGKRQ